MATRKMFHGEYILFKDKNKWVLECLAQAKGFAKCRGSHILVCLAQQLPRATPFGALLLSVHLVSQGLWSCLQWNIAYILFGPWWFKSHISLPLDIWPGTSDVTRSLGLQLTLAFLSPGFKSPDLSPGPLRVSWQLQALSVVQKLRQHLFLLMAALAVGWLLLQTSCSRSQWVFSEGWILSDSFGRGGIITGGGDLLWDLSSCLLFLSLRLWVFPARLGKDLPG